jgi:ADP-ribose pyrophosphatase YjhB (NUDIX family)
MLDNEKMINSNIETEFMDRSIELLENQLSKRNYPDYPDSRYSIEIEDIIPDQLEIPDGPWVIKTDNSLPDETDKQKFLNLGIKLDNYGKPLHPWLNQMVTNPNVGIVSGKGAYWNWGPNYTADPIVIRHDLKEEHVLLIERGDGTGWALPGGFVDPNESPDSAAVREAKEETGIDLSKIPFSIRKVYSGPLADLRVTANAWPETTAYRIDLNLNEKSQQKALIEMTSDGRFQKIVRNFGRFALRQKINRIPWKGSDDAKSAAWVPISNCDEFLFGSHSLLVELAMR